LLFIRYNQIKKKGGATMEELFKGLNTSEKVRLFMAAKGISKVELATLLTVSDETIRNWLKADTWDLNDLKKISAKYGVELTDLI
jgi:transcriptional regulator with XRE-family HTH domain